MILRHIFFFLGIGIYITSLTALAVGDESSQTIVESPDGRSAIQLHASGDAKKPLQYSIIRDGRPLFGPSPLGLVLKSSGPLSVGAKLDAVSQTHCDGSFSLPWGKTKSVIDLYNQAEVTITSGNGIRWSLELRAYNDGVAFRTIIPSQDALSTIEIRGEATEFAPAGNPTAHFMPLESFTSSHEALYQQKPLAELPAETLFDVPLLLVWPNGQAAAIAEAALWNYAGLYLEKSVDEIPGALSVRLSPLPDRENLCVVGKAPLTSPWRVVQLGDHAGELIESNLLLCLNDPASEELGDFAWALPGKTSFHWWADEFEKDYQLPSDSTEYLERHKHYIDFCAENNIAYHAVSGNGLSWYVQSSTDYGKPSEDADVRQPRPGMHLPEILAYAKERGVGIRLWVHWQPLSKNLEEAFTLYQNWGVQGLMVDFLDRDDQEMVDFTEQMMESAARHKLHIQIHGSTHYSGEQRTFPNLFNREGVLNLEYVKWSDLWSPDHTVNVAYTRALAGPVDYHSGGFHSVARSEFEPQYSNPVVLGTRCHHLATYVIFENPMPMVADKPSRYEGQAGFDFIVEVPTTWDETRFVAGEPGEYLVLARRSGDTWYLGGITDWTSRKLEVALDFLGDRTYEAHLYVDGSLKENEPNAITEKHLPVTSATPLKVSLAPGGGFVAVLRPR
ncbi:glycoside hydrolase family 97 protein [Bythopirellula polymerisocia]|uniref:Retaining alpha-galactosidase n=1 Tax=Bythopirellula polymerisocia TaxID=2528003 RepID=A0A5C6CU69_9BACT|nr:glycoside hydrolase family 97 protein [Bythopirellula polymerisocia]TWU28120.1 Retaining alpha-galactosidase precursor [Bythopirellula polymerisocia]